MRQEFSDKAGGIQRVKALAQEERQRMAAEYSQTTEANRVKYLADQRELMLGKNPNWAEKATFSKDMGELKKFAAESYGFTEEDLAQVYDHRLIEMLKDAQQFKSGKKAMSEKIVKGKLPKFQKPGAPKANSAVLRKARAVKAQKKAIRDSGGSVDSIARSIVDRM